jgi:ribonuclease PH
LADNTYVEVQGTGEHATFSAAELEKMLKLASAGIAELHAAQRKALHLKKAFPRAASAR